MRSLPRFSVENPVLVNMLTLAVLAGGLHAGFTIVREMFPESRPYQIVITTPYPGATPAEVEKGIAQRIEEAIKGIEGIDKIETTASEGLSVITVTLENDVRDVDQKVQDIQTEIDAIPRDEFPEEAEETRVVKFEPKLPVIEVSVYGEVDEHTLKRAARRLRDEILELPDVSDVLLSGVRKSEISVEVAPATLVRYGLSFGQIGEAIARGNLDLPGGQIKSPDSTVAVRTLGERDTAERIADLVVRSTREGEVLRLGDIARVVDGFEDAELVGRLNGQPAATVTVYKTGRQDALRIARQVRALVAAKRGEPLPMDWWDRLRSALGLSIPEMEIYRRAARRPLEAGLHIVAHTDLSRFIRGRLELLQRNGLWGLALVFASLLVFLNWRVALWVMCGLAFSILGTLLVMQWGGMTLNLISMFSIIVVLGLVVDDAIVVGENVFAQMERGLSPKEAAVTGTTEVLWPVISAVTTTIVAFLPLLFIEGRMGDFMGVLPVIVMTALGISLVEALCVLPAHLAESLRPLPVRGARRGSSWWVGVRQWQARVVGQWLMGWYERLIRRAIAYRYVTVSLLVAGLIVCGGLVAGGRVPVVFIQKMDSETLIASVEMPVGTPFERTAEAVRVIEEAAADIPEMQIYYTLIGARLEVDAPIVGSASHIGQVIMELVPIEERDRTSEDILRELRSRTANIPGVNRLTYQSMQGGPGGREIEMEITGERMEDLVAVAEAVRSELASFAGVYDIADDFEAGRREVQIELLDSARALGFTTQSLASQVRAAFYGLEARVLQRDREDVKIMVRYPEAYRRSLYDLQHMWLAAPDGRLVPFREVARFRESRGYSTIRRRDQKRSVTVSADVDQAQGNAEQIQAALEPRLRRLEAQYPGVHIRFAGSSEELAKSLGSLKRDFLFAVGAIYVILAALFRSYIQPLIVMAAIPFGLIGAVVGHLVLGFPLTLLSMIGLVALTGIVVNDSLILVDFANRLRREGVPLVEAVVRAGKRRLRPIVLTTMTTILGLAPLMMEQSFQARFLIPMAISITAGLAFATFLTLVGVPALMVILYDVRRLGVRLVRLGRATPVPAGG